MATSYGETHRYGLVGEEEWIASYGGLAAVGDSVFLYDQLRSRIVHLSGELVTRESFGRAGMGPGEFNTPFPITWLADVFEGHVAFNGRHLVIYDRLDLAAFDSDGEFRWSTRLPTIGVVEGVRFVGAVDDDKMIFGVDSVGFTSRRLQLWQATRGGPDEHDLLWETTVPWQAQERLGVVALPGRREARSYWARHQDCVVVSDGGRRLLWIINLSTLQADSIALPEWEVPEFGELSGDRQVINIGGRNVEPKPRRPTLLRRWTGLIVDPDGHAWVRAWTESPDEFQVFVVSIASGQSRRFSPPGFPTAFGPPGVFYTPRVKAETDEQYLVRLQAAQR